MKCVKAHIMSKPHVIELNCVNESDMVIETSPEEYIGSWEEYYDSIFDGSLDDIWFSPEDIDQNLFIVDDGGELIRLKSGTFVNIVFRGNSCHVWEEDDEERIDYILELLKNYG